MVDTSDEWIVSRTGHRASATSRRRASSPRTSPSERPGLRSTRRVARPDDIDLIVLATATPDNTFPSTAVPVQHRLGITKGAAFDVAAVCSGFVYAMTTADALIAQGLAKPRAGDRRGDVLAHPRLGGPHHLRPLRRRGRRRGAGGQRTATAQRAGAARHHRRLPALRRRRTRTSSSSTADRPPRRPSATCACAGRRCSASPSPRRWTWWRTCSPRPASPPRTIDWFVPHQANKRIINSSAEEARHRAGKGRPHGAAPRQHLRRVDPAGAGARRPADGRIKRGDLVLLEAMGGGFTWGARSASLVKDLGAT